MGTKQFQTEYIDYLEKRNTELLNRINRLKENYESKILAKDFNKQYLTTALEDVLNVCSTISEEIDSYFDKMSAAMGEFKNILLRKSEMVQLVDKISKVLNPIKNGDDLVGVDDSSLMKEQARIENKTGSVKVSQIINEHVMSKEPRFYIRRVQEMFTPDRRNEGHQLSPIIEASPDTSSDPSNSGGFHYKEIIAPLEKINLNKLSYISEESPKSRFKGPKTWKKSLTSNMHQPDHQKNTVSHENSENLNKKYSVGEVDLSHLAGNIDPLEGPSWLHEEIPEMSSSASQFRDYQRRKHRFATVFDKNCITNFEKTSKRSLRENSNEFNENEQTENEEDFEGSEKKFSESSEDFIGESYVSESEDNDSSKRRICSSSERELAKKTNSENDTEVVKSHMEASILNSDSENLMSTCDNPNYSGSSVKESKEKISIRQSKKRKSSLRPSFNKFYVEHFVIETPTRISRVKRGSRISKTRKIRKKKNTSDPNKLESNRSAEGVITEKSKIKSPKEEKKSVNSELERESKSSMESETEGRKRRKAAPAFKLVEPQLKTKLRRN